MADRARDYVATFNAAVLSGDWSCWAELLDDGVVMEFAGIRAGPYVGREQVLAAYRQQPPDDTIDVEIAATDGEVDVVGFIWSRGGRGLLRLTWQAGRLIRLVVEFG